MPKILYKYPSRSRPIKLFDSLDNFYKLVSHDDYNILLTLDCDDPSAIKEDFSKKILDFKNLIPMWGYSEGKVSAINRDMVLFQEWDILVVLSDDMVLKEGFDTEILKSFEDGFSGLVHFPDAVVNERLCTFSVMDKAYYDLFGYIYNPIYKSVYCDQEQHAIAVMLDRYKYVPVKIVKHLHPAFGLAPNDDLYRRNEGPLLYAEDGNTYRQRAANNFNIINPKKCNPFLAS